MKWVIRQSLFDTKCGKIFGIYFSTMKNQPPVLHTALHALTSCTLLPSIAVAADMHGLVTLGGDDTCHRQKLLTANRGISLLDKECTCISQLCTIVFHLVCAYVCGGGVSRMHTLNCMGACPYFSYRNFTGVPAPIASMVPMLLWMCARVQHE